MELLDELNQLNISKGNAHMLTNASNAFSGCESLEDVILPNGMVLLKSTEYKRNRHPVVININKN